MSKRGVNKCRSHLFPLFLAKNLSNGHSRTQFVDLSSDISQNEDHTHSWRNNDQVGVAKIRFWLTPHRSPLSNCRIFPGTRRHPHARSLIFHPSPGATLVSVRSRHCHDPFWRWGRLWGCQAAKSTAVFSQSAKSKGRHSQFTEVIGLNVMIDVDRLRSLDREGSRTGRCHEYVRGYVT
jgi:hypothetical protein